MTFSWTYLNILFSVAAGVYFAHHRNRRYLQYLQQEDYNSSRFLRWIQANRTYDKRGWITAIATVAAAAIAPAVLRPICYLGGAFVFLLWTYIERAPKYIGRKPLVLTERARRIERTALLASGVFLALIWMGLQYFLIQDALRALWLALALLHLASPLSLVLAVYVLQPHERQVHQRFKGEALDRLAAVSPTVIGITGSYGKTSTKAILSDLMTQCLEPTFSTPKSVNTVMGITRELRTNIHGVHRFAVFEMGAYGIGSITTLCDFVRPTVGIITAVGIMHLERFGSEENVYRAKSELARALPEDGILVCNGDNAGARRISVEFPKQTTLLYGLDPSQHLDCYATDIELARTGMKFVIHWKGESYPVQSCLFGTNAISNLLGSYTLACALGADPFYAASALANIEPVNNRLSFTKSSTISFLNDAYNSNPSGFGDALDVLEKHPARPKYLVTPGMIELGERQHQENYDLAKKAAGICDHVLLINSVNCQSWQEGLRDGGMAASKIEIHETMPGALKALEERGSSSEPPIVLIENDLGDVYDRPAPF